MVLCNACQGGLQVGFGHPSLVLKEMCASAACPSCSAGNRQKALVAGQTLLQPRSEMLGKHLGL